MEWMTIEEREHASTGNYQDYMKYVKNIDPTSLFFNDHPYAMSMVTNEDREGEDLSSRDISDFNDWLSIEERNETSREQQHYKSVKNEEGACLINRSPQDYLNWNKNEDTVVLSVIDHQYAKGMTNTAEREHLTASPFYCSKDWVNSDRWAESSSKDHWDRLEDDDPLSLGHYEDYMYCLKMMKNRDHLPTNDHPYAKYQVIGEESEALPTWPISCPNEQITNREFGKAMSAEPHNSMDWLNIGEGDELFTWNTQDYINGMRIEDGEQLLASNRQPIVDQTNETKRGISSDRSISFCKGQIVGEGGMVLPRDYWNSKVSVKIEAGTSEPVRNSKDYLNWGKIETGDAPCINNQPIRMDIVKGEKNNDMSSRENGVKIEADTSELVRNSKDYLNWGNIEDGEVSSTNSHKGSIDEVTKDHIQGMSASEILCAKSGVSIEVRNSEPVRDSKDYLNWGNVEDRELPSTNNHQDRIDEVKKENIKSMSAREVLCTKNTEKLKAVNSEPVRNSKDYLNWGNVEGSKAPSTNNHQDCIDEVKKETIKVISPREVSCMKNGVKTEAGNSEPIGNSKYYLSWVEMEKGEVSCTNNRPKSINKLKKDKLEDLSTRVVLYIENGVIMARKYTEPVRNSKDYLNRGKTENGELSSTKNHQDSIAEVKREKIKDLPARKISCTRGRVQIVSGNSKPVRKNVKMNGEAAYTSNREESINNIKREETEVLCTRKFACTKNVKVEEVKEDLHRENLVSNPWVKMEECESSLSINYTNNVRLSKVQVSGASAGNSPHIIDQVKGVERKYLSARDISCSKDQIKVEGMESLRNSQISSLWVKLEEVERASSSSCPNYTNWVQVRDGGELSLNTGKNEVTWRKKEERKDRTPRDIVCCVDRNRSEECKEIDGNPLKSMGITNFKKVEKLHVDSVKLVKSEEIEKTSCFEQESVHCSSSENGEEISRDKCHLDSGDEEAVLNCTAEDTAITNRSRKLVQWNPPEVVALLDAVGTSRHLNSLVSSDRSRNTDAFTEISIILQKAGHSRTPAQCRSKMKTLRRLFHTKWITGSGKSGEVGMPFWVEHFSRIWALAGKPKYLFFKPPIL